MSLLREQSSVPGNRLSAPYSNTQASEPAGKLRTGHRDFKGGGTSLLNTKSKAEPSNGSLLQSLIPAEALHICSIYMKWDLLFETAKSARYGLGLSCKVPENIDSSIVSVSKCNYLNRRKKWAAVAPAIPWNSSVYQIIACPFWFPTDVEIIVFWVWDSSAPAFKCSFHLSFYPVLLMSAHFWLYSKHT